MCIINLTKMQTYNSFKELATAQTSDEHNVQSAMSVFNAPYPSFRGRPIDIRTERYAVDEKKADGDEIDASKIVATQAEKNTYHDRLCSGQKFYGVIPPGCTTIPGLKPNENVLYGDKDSVEGCHMEDSGAALESKGYIRLPDSWTTKIISLSLTIQLFVLWKQIQ